MARRPTLKDVAELAGVSVSAVRQRMNALCAKTGLGSRAELAALAMTLGLLPDPINRGDAEEYTDMLVEMDETGIRRTVAPM